MALGYFYSISYDLFFKKSYEFTYVDVATATC